VDADLPSKPGMGWRAAPEQRLVLYNVPWHSYVQIGDALPDRPALRMTFHRTTLELVTTSAPHEIFKRRLSWLLATMAEEMNVPLAGYGSTTFRREDLDMGFEPDECYYVAHEKQCRAMKEWLPDRDPPPDLILEVEICRSVLNRMTIFAAFGVPEVWRCDSERIDVHLRRPDATYRVAERSLAFPRVMVQEIARFARPNTTMDSLATVRAFRAWVREQLARPA
jgi:Uma2 family endonuclease